MNEENKSTRPDTPTLGNVEKKDVVSSMSERLSSGGIVENKESREEPQAKPTNMIDMNNLTTEQVQSLQELFENTPRRDSKKEKYHTIQLRVIDGKPIVECGRSYMDLKHDPVQRRDVMKTMIPVRFSGEDKMVDILWSEDFMLADKITCRIVEMDKKEVPEVVGRTLKRDTSGGLTTQEVEMYVNKVVVMLKVKLPSGEIVSINSEYAN